MMEQSEVTTIIQWILNEIEQKSKEISNQSESIKWKLIWYDVSEITEKDRPEENTIYWRLQKIRDILVSSNNELSKSLEVL